MVSCVFFRFKHQKGFDRIEFEGSEISIAELKLKIIEKLVLVEKYSHASAIQLYRPSTDRDNTNAYGEMYEFDNELIPANSSVLILRTPTKKVGERIRVENNAASLQTSEDPFALKESVIAHEQKQLKRVPDALVCTLCKHFMAPPDNVAVVLHCCGQTICRSCAVGKSQCPLEPAIDTRGFRFGLNRGLGRLAEVVLKNRAQFVPDEGVIFPACSVPDQPQQEAEEEVVDLEEVVDVDKPLTAKELELIERRARRKRKAEELLLKREGKSVKGELTEGEISKLLKQEIKADLDDVPKGEWVSGGSALRRPSIVEFPKLLTCAEFERWSKSR